jgi:stage III sporulation protein AB
MEILVSLKNLMCSLGTPLSVSFEIIGKEDTGGVWSDIFLESSRIMKEQHRDAGWAWKDALYRFRDQLPLSHTEVEALDNLGELLGKSDRISQETIIDMEKEKIALLEKKARELADTKGKLYRNLGPLTGAAMVILLI